MMNFLMGLFFGLSSFAIGGEVEVFLSEAKTKHGAFGEKAAKFLVAGMPKGDREKLTKDFLMKNLDLAINARENFPWGKMVPEEVFFNDVLPYASLDETREDWRTSFYGIAEKLVSESKTTSEAAQAINKGFFKIVNVHYGRKRKAPNQSPTESIEIGKATCTGLSIILVDACRSVGVPARIAGTAMWADKRGNHTWVEIWDGGEWFFAGADEYDAKGLNRGWFVKDASMAVADKWQHAIWASSWEKTGTFFPMVWNIKNREVPAVNVTMSYAAKKEESGGVIYFRVWDSEGGERIVASLNGIVKSKAGSSDLNDMAELRVQAGDKMSVTFGKETREVVVPEGKTVDLYWDQLK